MVIQDEALSWGRVVFVDGARTPFSKRGTSLDAWTPIDLGARVVRGLLDRLRLSDRDVDLVVYGQAMQTFFTANMAREIVLRAGLAPSIDAFSVSRACATSTQAVASAAAMIASGQARIAIAGGADSASQVPMIASRPLSNALVKFSEARRIEAKIRALAGLRWSDWRLLGAQLKEPSTGLSMGESAEKMAKENDISRADQDAFAHRSHVRASDALARGFFDREVIAVPGQNGGEELRDDNALRKDSSLTAYARLRPVFDPVAGSVTAGNSSPLTDGASAVVMMRDDVARALGYPPLAHLRSVAFVGIDPREQLLMGPAYAIPRALFAAGMPLSACTLVDIHEAFSAQVLSNIRALASARFAVDKLGRSEALGEIPDEKLNVHGGSIALGHPFAATGTRQLTTVMRELERCGGGVGLVAQCAAGGLGAAVVVERM